MTMTQFNCPHCRSPFQVDISLPSLQVACPHCQQPVALISEPPVVEPPLAAPPGIDPPLAEPGIAAPPRVPRGHSPADLLPPRAIVSSEAVGSPEKVVPQQAEEREAIADDYRSRQLAADEQASRKLIKNMIVWVCCAIVLVSILAFFLMQRGS